MGGVGVHASPLFVSMRLVLQNLAADEVTSMEVDPTTTVAQLKHAIADLETLPQDVSVTLLMEAKSLQDDSDDLWLVECGIIDGSTLVVVKQRAINQEEFPLLLGEDCCTKGDFAGMFKSMTTSIINDNMTGGEDFKKLKDNPEEQAVWLKKFGEFSFSRTPSEEVIKECMRRFDDMRIRRPGLFQPQVDALRAAGGPAKVLLEFCERFHEMWRTPAEDGLVGEEEGEAQNGSAVED